MNTRSWYKEMWAESETLRDKFLHDVENAIVKAGGRCTSDYRTESLEEYVLSGITDLGNKLADAIAKRDALMDCFFEFETIAPNGELMASVLDMHKRLESLESQLAEAQARLAGYEQMDSHGAAFSELAKGAE